MLTINLTSALKWQKCKLSNENQSGYSSMFLHTFQALVVTRFARKSFFSWDRVSLHQWSSTYGSWPLWGHAILSTGVAQDHCKTDILQFIRAATSAAVNAPNSDLTSFKIPQALRNIPYLLLRNKKVVPLHLKISKIQESPSLPLNYKPASLFGGNWFEIGFRRLLHK